MSLPIGIVIFLISIIAGLTSCADDLQTPQSDALKGNRHDFEGFLDGKGPRTRRPRPPGRSGRPTVRPWQPVRPESPMFDDSMTFQRFRRFHRGWRPFGPPVPPFLLNATEDARKTFREIMCSRNLTRSEIENKIDQLIATQTDDVRKAYAEFKKKRDEDIAEFEEKRKEAVAKLSQDAQAADAKIALIIRDDSLTHEQRHDKIRVVFDSLTESVREELRTVAPKRFFGRRGHKGPYGPGGPMGPMGISGVMGPIGVLGPKGQQFGVFGSMGLPSPMNMRGPGGRWKKPNTDTDDLFGTSTFP